MVVSTNNGTVQFHILRALANYASIEEFSQFFKVLISSAFSMTNYQEDAAMELLTPYLESSDPSVQEETVRCFAQLICHGAAFLHFFSRSYLRCC